MHIVHRESLTAHSKGSNTLDHRHGSSTSPPPVQHLQGSLGYTTAIMHYLERTALSPLQNGGIEVAYATPIDSLNRIESLSMPSQQTSEPVRSWVLENPLAPVYP